ncbi:hypothetical protein FIBSPDRAFT_864517, partial [Athelia psychrophila]
MWQVSNEVASIDGDIAQVHKRYSSASSVIGRTSTSFQDHKAMLMPPPLPVMYRAPPEVRGVIFMACNEVTWKPGYPKLNCN